MSKHLLGVIASKAYNMETEKEEYMEQMEVSQDVLDWLSQHDIKMSPEGHSIFVCNAVEYSYLGPVPKKTAVIISSEIGQA